MIANSVSAFVSEGGIIVAGGLIFSVVVHAVMEKTISNNSNFFINKFQIRIYA